MSSMVPMNIDPPNQEVSADEVEGSELPDYPAVSVVVETPVRIRNMPNESGDVGSLTVDTSTPDAPLFNADPRRALLVLIAKTNPMIIARTQQGLRNGAEWPVGVPFNVTHKGEVWVKAQTATCQISFAHELWTD